MNLLGLEPAKDETYHGSPTISLPIKGKSGITGEALLFVYPVNRSTGATDQSLRFFLQIMSSRADL